jgi:membrane protein DedA with SNARE-associated domain
LFESLIIRFGYAAILLGTFLEGETVLIAGGVAAQHGLLQLPLVMLAAFVGGFVGDQTWFRVGGRIGKPLIERRPSLAAKAALATRALERWGTLFVLGFRFVYGIRTVSPLLLGAASYPARRFLLLNGIGALAWAVSFGYLGFGAGAAFAAAIARLSLTEMLAIGIAVVAAGLLAWHVIARRRSLTPRP